MQQRLVYWEVNSKVEVKEPEAAPVLREIENGTLYKYVKDVWYESVGYLLCYRCLAIEYAGRKYIAKELYYSNVKEIEKEIAIFLIE
ncbi:MAG: hypothetical protein QXT28_06240 [Thermofilaceae archaeon]